MIGRNTPPIPPQDANDSGFPGRTEGFQNSSGGDDPRGSDRASLARFLRSTPMTEWVWSDALKIFAALERSRPGVLPDVRKALEAIEAMKRGDPVVREDIQAIVALAEIGADELEGFDIRWKADMRAIDLWRAAHPGNDLVLPDHADLVVWLMDVFDCSFDRPTVSQVENVRARLGAAQLRAPNALTKDARDIVDQLTDALRKTSRRAFMAEERARAAEAANVQWEHPDHRGITHQHVETHRVGVVEQTTISTIYGEREVDEYAGEDGRMRHVARSAMDSDFDALVAEARKARIVDDAAKTIWRQPGEAGALLATKLGQLTGYRVKDRTAPTLDEHLATAPHADCADCRAMEADPAGGVINLLADGWIVENGAGDRWRGWGDVGPIWVDDREKATRYARRQDAETVHAEDDDAWRIVPFAQGGHADTEGEAMALFAHLDCPICGGSGHIDDAKERLHERLVDLLTRELGDAYDCTRVWAAWEVGTMSADDFEPVTDRMDDLVEGVIAQLCAPDQVESDRESLDRVEARLDADVLATVPAEPIGGKNTADYDRRQMEDRINAELASLPPGSRSNMIDVTVLGIAPGWEYAIAPMSDPPLVTLVRYAPGEPI